MARNRWLRVRPRLLPVDVAVVDVEFAVAVVDADSCEDEIDADADANAEAEVSLCRLRTLLLLLPDAVVVDVAVVLAVAILPRLPCVVRLLAEDGLPPFKLRCGGDDFVDFVVDVDGKDKDGDADSAVEE
jgi:hypothetical protein